MNAGFAAEVGGDLVQVNNQIKVKEDKSMEELNSWNREIKVLETMLNIHDSIMKEATSKPKDEEKSA